MTKFHFPKEVIGGYNMDLFIFALMIILVFTALAIERILKDIRDQNKEIIKLLKEDKIAEDTKE